MTDPAAPRTLDVVAQGYGGEGTARDSGGRFISLPRALPGDRVLAEVGPFVRGRAWGHVEAWLERSPDHVEPDCHRYAQCSGCALRHVDRATESRFKRDAAAEILARYGPEAAPNTIEWVASEGRLGHRARGRFDVRVDGDRVLLGLRSIRLDRALVDIRDCPAQTESFRRWMGAVGACLERHPDQATTIERVEVATVAEVARLGLYLNAPLPDQLARELIELATAGGAGLVTQLGRTVVPLVGRRLLLHHPLGAGPRTLAVDVPWGSWFHAAPEPGRRLADWVAAALETDGGRRLLDLCCGLGTLTARLAPTFEEVLAIDEDRAAAVALESACSAAQIEHVRVRAGRLGTHLRKARRDGTKWDAAVINPMRRPLGSHQLRDLAALGVHQIVYLGPSPVAAAKDASYLSESQGFEVRRAAAVDLHPATAQFMLALALSRD